MQAMRNRVCDRRGLRTGAGRGSGAARSRVSVVRRRRPCHCCSSVEKDERDTSSSLASSSSSSSSSARRTSDSLLQVAYSTVERSVEGGAGAYTAGMLTPTAFAFLGDSVWEVYARSLHILPPSRVTTYRKRTEAAVMAEFQSQCLDDLEGLGVLDEEEKDIVRRGRNSNITTVPKRLSFHRSVYQKATALECLVGFLFLTRPGRLHDIMTKLGMVNASHRMKVKVDAASPT